MLYGTQGKCRGLRIAGDGFGKELCHQLGISRLFDMMAAVPRFSEKHNMLYVDLIEAKRVKADINLNEFALPTWQFEQELMEDEE